jgi:hypothetical protein
MLTTSIDSESESDNDNNDNNEDEESITMRQKKKEGTFTCSSHARVSHLSTTAVHRQSS